MFEIDPSRLIVAAIWWTVACLVLDGVIWRVNHWWVERHGATRHPFSPAFTGAGIAIIMAGWAYAVPGHLWLVAAIFASFALWGGGLMWVLHGRRDKFRGRDAFRQPADGAGHGVAKRQIDDGGGQ